MANILFVAFVLLGVLALAGAQNHKAYLTHAFDMKCNVCQVAVGALAGRQGDASWSSPADALLASECAKLEVGSELCKSKLLPLAEDIKTRVVVSSEPSKVCHEIKWCVADRNYFNIGPHHIPKDLPPINAEVAIADLKCAGCQGLFTYLKARLGSKLNSTQLAAQLKGICSKAPMIVQGLCNQLVDGKLSQILPIFDQENPVAICQSLKLCSMSMKRFMDSEDADAEEDFEAKDDEDVEYDEDDVDADSDHDDVADDDIDVESADDDSMVSSVLKREVADEDEDVEDDDHEDLDDEDAYPMDYIEGDFDNIYDESDSDVDSLQDAEVDSEDSDSEDANVDLPQAVLKREVELDDTDTAANFDDIDEEDIDDEDVEDDDDDAEDSDDDDINSEDSDDEDIDTEDSDDENVDDEDSDDEDIDAEDSEDEDVDDADSDDEDADDDSDEDVDDDDLDMEDSDDEDVEDEDDEDVEDNDTEDADDDVGISMKRIVDPIHEDARVFYFGLDGKKVAVKPFNPNVNTGDAECQICQWAVSAVEAYISQQDTEQELARVLQELCTVLPGNYATICQNFVVVYMDEAVNYVIDNLTPPLVCSKLDVCQAPPTPQTPSIAL